MNYSGSEKVFIEYGSNRYENTFWQPNFLNNGKSLCREHKQEWRAYLLQKNLQQMSMSVTMNKKALRYSFYSKTIVRTVFDICKFMRQPPEVRYLALEILDRFMICHFFNVARTLIDNGNWSCKTWRIVTTRMINQSFLRIISSIQLASKYCNNFRAVPIAEFQKVLNSSGQTNFSSKYDIIKSEVRVFQTIEFSIPIVTPLTYIEMFFDDFDNEEIKKHLCLTLSSFLNVCIDVLDVAIIFHKEIFHSLYTRITGKPYLTFMDSKFLSIEADYMYLATAVIYASAALQDPPGTVAKTLLRFFSSVTQYKPEEITNLGNVLLEIILIE